MPNPMTASPRYTCNHQLAGYAFDYRDEMGAIDFPSFVAAFEAFPWGEQMRQRETMAGGCSATISVADQEQDFVFWVSVMGDDLRPTFLLGAVYNKKQRKSARIEVPGMVRWCEIRIAPSRRSVLSTFRILFAGDTLKLMKQFRTYKLFDRHETSALVSISNSETMSDEFQEPAEPLGHGDHWQAMGLGGGPLIEYLNELAKKADGPRFFPTPWPNGEYSKVVLMSLPRGYMSLLVLFGINEREKALSMLSAFPAFTRTTEWIVCVDKASSAYGPYEGVVCARASAGHGLKFFAPFFGLEAEQWRRPGLARVALSGLALRLETFDASPIRVTEGPLVEDAKRELRAEGRDVEADDPDFHVTVEMDKMRTLYSLNHDHHQIIGRVVAVATARPSPRFQGWRLEIECMPDKAISGCRLPVFVFPPALGAASPPRKGDLVTGTVWLQGSWISGETESDLETWRESGGD